MGKMTVSEAEKLSAAQQNQIKQNKSRLKEGQVFLIDIGEGGKRLAQYKNGKLNTLGFKYPTDWQGKTIGQWQNSITNKAISELGINKNNIIDLSNDKNYLWRDVVKGIPVKKINDFNQFKSEYTPLTKASDLTALPTTDKNGIEGQTDVSSDSKKKQINSLYQKYFGRNASSAELQDKIGLTPAQIESFLSREYKKYSGGEDFSGKSLTTSNDVPTETNKKGEDILTDQQKEKIKALNDEIDTMTNDDGTPLTVAEKAVLKELASQDWTNGQHVFTPDELTNLIKQAAINAETDLNPYYEKTFSRNLEDFRKSMEDIRNQASNYQKQEENNYAKMLAETKKNLRQRGLTFSGISRSLLGDQTTLKNGGMNVEGYLPTNRRLNYERAINNYQRSGNQLGTEYERLLGSQRLNDQYKLNTPYGEKSLYNKKGNITGDLDLERLKELERKKWDILSKYKSNIN